MRLDIMEILEHSLINVNLVRKFGNGFESLQNCFKYFLKLRSFGRSLLFNRGGQISMRYDLQTVRLNLRLSLDYADY